MALDHLIAPGFLVASPRLDGSLFERSVIVMVHHDGDGAMGLIANKPLEVDFGSLLEMVEIDVDRIANSCYETTVYFGGPVRVEQLWVIYNGVLSSAAAGLQSASPQERGDIRFHPHWALSGASDSIEGFAFGMEANDFLPFVGYAGWGAGQLENEVEEGSWLMLDFDEALIMSTEPDEMWNAALARLGVDETAFLMMGKAGSA